MGQLTLVPQLLSLCTLERMRSSRSPQLGKAHMEQQRTSAAKNKEINKLKPLSSSSKSVPFSRSVVYDSLRPHGLQHTRLPCPSPSLGLLRKLRFSELVMPCNHLILCHPLSLRLQSFPSGSLPMRWPFASDGQSIGAFVLESIF